TSTVYDLLGKVLHQPDPLGRTTTMAYALMGRLVSTSYPGGTSETRSYDAEGRLLAQIDRAGRTTAFAYDAAGRLKTTTYPDGATAASAYNDAGQLVATTDARDNTTSYVYDAAGRRTAVIDPLGKGPTFTYDSGGNQESVTDARGFTTSFTYDALHRLTVTTYPDDTTTAVAYDALGRRGAETDQAGLTTRFGYDALGRLTTVTDALDQVTRYTWDEVGNRLTQTDANGHTTRFEYDALGRQTARILPDDARESMTYHPDGTLASHTAFNGAMRTFAYDANRRLTRRAYPDGSEVTFTYTPTGQRATVTDARGTTSYTYDARDHLIEKVDPTGYKLGYGYDLQGNRTRLTATVGAQVFTTTYAHDELNRIETVTDSQGGVTTLGYDDNGNRADLAHPNGVTTAYTYDGLSRLSHLETVNSVGNVLQSYAYTLGAAGNRTRIDEHDGTSRHYVYDNLYRLTQDRVTDPDGVQVYQRDFTYDPVGNRLTQVIDDGGGQTTVTSIYDDRDRLEAAGPTSYGWNANGNLTSKAEGGVTTYAWDYDDRLATVILGDGTVVETAYDADGNRVRSSVTPPGGPPAEIDYLVDTMGSLSYVAADVATGSKCTLYTRADEQLIGLYRQSSGSQRYYHLDGLGSTRVLSDQAGAVAGRYAYMAYGETLVHSGDEAQVYRFAGEPYNSESGFYYNRARWMDVGSGRFVGLDQFHGRESRPLSLHGYLYAAPNPVVHTDPTGKVSRGLLSSLVALAALSVLGTLSVRRIGAGRVRTLGPIPVKIRRVVIVNRTWAEAEVLVHLDSVQRLFWNFGIGLSWEPIEHMAVEKSLGETWTGEDFRTVRDSVKRRGEATMAFIGSPFFPRGKGQPEHEGLTHHNDKKLHFFSAIKQGTSPRWTGHEVGHLLGEIASHWYGPGNLMSLTWGTDLNEGQLRMMRETHLARHPFN
ncbi:MAG: RHS repeat protein, partial [bacterium]|nr:RHS repeat protein [bacterium]